MQKYFLSGCIAWAVCCCLQAEASIQSPISVVLNTAGNFGSSSSIQNTINQSGLSQNFTSGVTDFDTYLAGNPTHTIAFTDSEWFAPSGVHSSTIIYDLGQVFSITRLALWNEDSTGISNIIVDTSLDAGFGSFTSVGNFNPTDNPMDLDYSAEVFDLSPDSVGRYIRLTAVSPGEGIHISMGEIAFETFPAATNSNVPEPTSLLVWSMLGIVGLKRRRHKA